MAKMNFSKSFKSGFTLIELLVVVALVGILSSVTLGYLNSSRSKGADASVKSNLHTIANQAELFFLNNSNSYLPAGGSTFAIATCPPYNALGTNMIALDKNLSIALAEAVARGGNGSSCYNSASVFSIAVGLKSNPATSWCVDSMGTGKQEPFAPAAAINPVTFICK